MKLGTTLYLHKQIVYNVIFSVYPVISLVSVYNVRGIDSLLFVFYVKLDISKMEVIVSPVNLPAQLVYLLQITV